MASVLSTLLSNVPILIQVAQAGAQFESGQPISITVPPESYEADLTAEGLGHVKISEAGTTVTIQKVV